MLKLSVYVLVALVNVLDHNDKVTAQGGKVNVHITNGQPKIYTSLPIGKS